MVCCDIHPFGSGLFQAGVIGLSCVGNQIHAYVVWQVSLPIPSSPRC